MAQTELRLLSGTSLQQHKASLPAHPHYDARRPATPNLQHSLDRCGVQDASRPHQRMNDEARRPVNRLGSAVPTNGAVVRNALLVSREDHSCASGAHGSGKSRKRLNRYALSIRMRATHQISMSSPHSPTPPTLPPHHPSVRQASIVCRTSGDASSRILGRRRVFQTWRVGRENTRGPIRCSAIQTRCQCAPALCVRPALTRSTPRAASRIPTQARWETSERSSNPAHQQSLAHRPCADQRSRNTSVKRKGMAIPRESTMSRRR